LAPAADVLELHREHVASGEWWRLMTGHFVHFGQNHFLWDLAVFLVLGGLLESGTQKQTNFPRITLIAVLIVSGLAISIAVLFFQPHVIRYRGLSGIDSALFGAVACSLALRARTMKKPGLGWICLVSLVGFLAKSVYELSTHDALFVSSSQEVFEPVPLAHLVGLVAGAATGYATRNRARLMGVKHLDLKRPGYPLQASIKLPLQGEGGVHMASSTNQRTLPPRSAPNRDNKNPCGSKTAWI
ncbi:MAG TPA: rhombosortase, partial [Opitutaceae bacterium]|nr:rhombosortase [Opitutaceae bacterium]